MGKGGKRSLANRLKREAENPPPTGPLGKWAAFTSRGTRVFGAVPIGPIVKAKTPEELATKTAEALAEKTEGEPEN